MNWIKETNPSMSLNDKIKELLKNPSKLVLVQIHELERIRSIKNKQQVESYVNQLYDHYIVKKQPKRYLC